MNFTWRSGLGGVEVRYIIIDAEINIYCVSVVAAIYNYYVCHNNIMMIVLIEIK